MANKKASAEALKECQLEKTTMLVSTKDRKAFNDQNRDGYVPLYSSLKTFYIRNFVRRLRYILDVLVSSLHACFCGSGGR
jgi:hypothetical protein